MRQLRFYRCGTGSNFEVFEYEPADGQPPIPRNSDIGGHHLAFYVDDLDAAVDYLRAEGIRVLGEPTASRNASAGQRWVYFLQPVGHAVRAGQLSERQGLREGRRGAAVAPARDPAA